MIRESAQGCRARSFLYGRYSGLILPNHCANTTSTVYPEEGVSVMHRAFLAMKGLPLLAMACLTMPVGLRAQSVTLVGATNNQVLVNGQKVLLTAAVANAAQDRDYSLSIYDGNKFLFGRPLTPDAALNYTMVWEWPDPPLGSHTLQAVLIGNPFANP